MKGQQKKKKKNSLEAQLPSVAVAFSHSNLMLLPSRGRRTNVSGPAASEQDLLFSSRRNEQVERAGLRRKNPFALSSFYEDQPICLERSEERIPTKKKQPEDEPSCSQRSVGGASLHDNNKDPPSEPLGTNQ